MKQLLLVFAVVALLGCGESAEEKAAKAKAAAADWKVIEAAIRKELKKPAGELTKADLEKVTSLFLRNGFGNVYLNDNRLTSVKGLEKLTQLTTLNLVDNKLTDVKGLEKLKKLKMLALGDNQLTSVKGLAKLTQLEELYLGSNQLTDVKGLEKLTQLKELSLGYNKLTSIKGLEKLTQLKELDLNDNPDLTKAQIDELQKALPKCEIKHDAK